MFADISKPAAPLPTADLSVVCDGVALLPPLSRRGHGPGLVLLLPDSDNLLAILDGVPAPLVKWSEEGYTVVTIKASALTDSEAAQKALKAAVGALRSCAECEPRDKIGLVAYDSRLWNATAPALSAPELSHVAGCVVYLQADEESCLIDIQSPVLRHVAGASTPTSEAAAAATTTLEPSKAGKRYSYPKIATGSFGLPFQATFNYSAEAISHTRSLSFLKALMSGPYFDLETIWDEHTYYEFADRSVEHTMSTMVQEPYVNHVPTMTGGIGRASLTAFYRDNFIFNNSADTDLELISRTVGIDRVVDEFIFKFTHDREIDWMLPGIPPTNRKVEIPFTAVINIRGDRLFHEHIAWDQASVLAQLGLLPQYLPYPYPVGNADSTDCGKHEYRVPIAGIETAEKMRNRNAVASNGMLSFQMRKSS